MRRLTLTFDNGPVAGATGRIVEILGRRDIKATFFVIGQRLADPSARREAERAHREGHWIGNHTMTHSGPLGGRRDRGHAEIEIGAAQQALGNLAHRDRLFRPVGGGVLGPHLLSGEAVDYLVAQRYTVVTWTNVPGDWRDDGKSWVERAIGRLSEEDWSVLVVHDHCLGEMMGTLEEFLDQADDLGTEFVQDFPDACSPISRGVVRDVRGLVTDR